MKILIVSGFLGAGKTTFIKALAKKTGRELAILENEYGAVGIDGENLKQDVGPVNIWELTEGCICCSTKGDFAASVLTIANTVDPEYLVIEPTGVGMLSNIIRNMQQIEYERIAVLAPITIVDGQSFLRSFADYKELYLDQVSSAATVFVSKLEHADAAERSVLEQELRKINPTAEIITEHYSTLPSEMWNRLFERLYDGTVIESPRPEAEVLPDSFSLKGASMDCPERLILLLEGLIHGRYGNIFRAKGKLRAGDTTLRFEAVDGRYSIEEAESTDDGTAVFIGTDIKRQALRKNFFVASQKIQLSRERFRSR